ncbi:homoserine O-succinyltransferase [Alloacidobacterium dinghuense]|uniref:Homoserine O-succinyltransferase n=1 Tax=Alloacidobacterium dinghuense TaxID=2763107 RepID=A0A7G8BPL3_9BACT|nr:homoserine O-succinyltransferase [Alloacidobacterium dinghuense]QNI34483.1 homoserine O-succinyltransferase [Alloacidobacterium dinghuense]
MPAFLQTNPSSSDRQPCAKGLCAKPFAECLDRSGNSLTIGLINNMPDGVLEATERQFLSLLNSSSHGISVRMVLYSLPGVPRNELGARHVSKSYSSVENLWDTQIDGLIVTGREPATPNLADEPYWESFTAVLDWARDNTYSTIWSCLATHAATLYLDGIHRIRSDHKHSGVFNCTRVSDHSLTAKTPSRFRLPHSRWNGLPESELTSRGYSVLTRTADAGVDTFIKKYKSMFVFFQGHPEYESNALLLEYRRDVGRYLRGETNRYPLMPQDYFDRDTVIALTELEQEATINPRDELLAQVFGKLERIDVENTWRETAVCIYRSWLQYIWAQKKRRLRTGGVAVKASGVDVLMSPQSTEVDASTSAGFPNHQESTAISTPSTSMLTIL